MTTPRRLACPLAGMLRAIVPVGSIHRMRLQWVIAFAILLLALTICAIYTLVDYVRLRQVTLTHIDTRLRLAADMAKESLPNDYHDNILNGDSVSPTQFHQIVHNYDRLCQTHGLEYVWSLLEIDGDLRFTSGTSQHKKDHQNHAEFFEIHTNPQAYDKALQTMQVQHTIIRDKWGGLRSVLVPALDGRGRKYLFGASVRLNDIDAVLNRQLVTSLGIGLSLCVLATFLSILLGKHISRPIAVLTERTEAIFQGHIGESVPVEGSRELRALTGSFNRMSQALGQQITALREREESLRATLDSIGDAVIATDAAGNVTRLNPIAERLTGWTAQEAQGKPLPEIFRIVNAKTGIAGENPVEKVLASGAIVGLANHTMLLARDGAEYQIADSGAPIRGADGEIVGVVLVFRDVTDEYRVQQELRDERNFSAEILEGSPAIICRVTPDGVTTFINPAGERICGYRREELVGKNWWETMFPGDEYRQVERLFLAFGRGDVSDYEMTLTTREGQRRTISWSAFNRRDENGSLLEMIGIGNDITDRKRAEEAIEKRIVALTQPLDRINGIAFDELFNLADIQRVQDLFAKATGVSSIITQVDGTPITKPSSFCRLCSEIVRQTDRGRAECYRSDATIGRHNPEGPIIRTCLSGGLWNAGASIAVGGKHIANWLVGQVRDETQTEEQMRENARRIGADEEAFLAAFREVPTMSRNQFEHVAQALFVLASQLSTTAYQNIQQARFIAERKHAEQEKAQLEDQLRQSQKMEAIGRLAGGVAHDFNNLLQVITGYTDLAGDELEDGHPACESLREVGKAAESAAALVGQLLAFSRRQIMRPEDLDINEVVVGLMKMLERVIGEHIRLELIRGHRLDSVHADRSMIEQILMNLSVNARDAMPAGGCLTIETENVRVDAEYCEAHPWAKPGRYVLLSVTDTGFGMDEDTLQRVFEPFFTSKGLGKGTGLGLATVYGIVKQHDGMITAYSEVDKGTTFKVYLPVNERRAATIGTKIEGAVLGGTETILLAEDDDSVRELARTMLQHAGYAVLAARNGHDAVNLFAEHCKDVDLLILDVVMPGMGGREAYEQIKAQRPDIPALFASGYSENAIHTNFVLEESLTLIQKPFGRRALLRAVREALDLKTSAGEAGSP